MTTNSGHTQKPSSASPTQLNASIEQAIAATDAKVAMAFTECMTKPFAGNDQILSNDFCPIMARIRLDINCGSLWPRCYSDGHAWAEILARKNPHLLHVMSESVGNLGHVSFSGRRRQNAPCRVHRAGIACARRAVAGFLWVAASAFAGL